MVVMVLLIILNQVLIFVAMVVGFLLKKQLLFLIMGIGYTILKASPDDSFLEGIPGRFKLKKCYETR